MKFLYATLAFTLLLSACSSSTDSGATPSDAASGGVQTLTYHEQTMQYDSGVWAFNADNNGLELQVDPYCWIDTVGDMTKPMPGMSLEKDYEVNQNGLVSVYSRQGYTNFASFALGDLTVIGSVDDPEDCIKAFVDLATLNTK